MSSINYIGMTAKERADVVVGLVWAKLQPRLHQIMTADHVTDKAWARENAFSEAVLNQALPFSVRLLPSERTLFEALERREAIEAKAYAAIAEINRRNRELATEKVWNKAFDLDAGGHSFEHASKKWAPANLILDTDIRDVWYASLSPSEPPDVDPDEGDMLAVAFGPDKPVWREVITDDSGDLWAYVATRYVGQYDDRQCYRCEGSGAGYYVDSKCDRCEGRGYVPSYSGWAAIYTRWAGDDEVEL
jgi:hypothetical protein